MKIVDLKATTVAVPLEAPLRHAAGAHWGRFVRTIVEVVTDEGLSGWGELGGGGESAESSVTSLLPYLKGHDPLQLEQLRWKIMNPVASLYNSRMQVHAAIEMACMDVAGKALGMRACDLIGGALREKIPFASYLFYRYASPETGFGDEFTAEAIVAEAKRQKQLNGFKTHKLKGGVFTPEHDVEVFTALADALPGDRFRLDPNSVWSVEESIWVAHQIEHIRNDYFEDPCFGLEGMRRLRERISIPTATNTVVVNFEQLAQCIKHDAVDVILLDTTFWGGLRQAYKAGQVLETFQFGASVHSSGELGIQLASMLHLGAALPNLSFAADAHYHHLLDDIIVGGKLKYVDGEIALPKGPGLGVEVDRDKLAHYAEYFHKVGGYTYDRDPARPDWYSIQPEMRYADPLKAWGNAALATVTLRDIVKVYGEFVAIKGIDLDIEDGTFVVFVGPSGCGKSTMLRMIAGLETISYGELKIGGKLVNDLPSRERGIAMVFQSYALYPHMSVNDNLGFGLKMGGVTKPEIERRRGEAAKMLGLEPYLERRPSQLSGGQRQRVAIGRAMVREPEVFLFDEPLSNLDAKLRNQTRVEIKRLQRQLGATVIFVTHDQVEAMTLADKIVVLNDGRIAQIGTPLEVFERPTNQFVAGFIGAPSMNFIDGVVGETPDGPRIEAAGLAVPVEAGRFDLPPAGTPVTLGIRPEDIIPEGHGTRPELGADFEAPVGFSEMLGNESLLFATLGSSEVVARMQHPRIVEPNEKLRFRIDGSRVHVFDKETQNSVRR